jgi:hypothetical protein
MSLTYYRQVIIGVLMAVAIPLLWAKDTPFQVVSWPDSGQPFLRFTFSKFKEIGGMGKERTYIPDTTVQNLSDKTISNASFSLYVFDRDKARVGEGYINLTNVAAAQTVKFQITLAASGTPASVTVSPSASAARTVQITVNSVPQGATFKLDGKEMVRRRRSLTLRSANTPWISAKRASTRGHFRSRSLRATRPAEASVTNWEAPHTTPSSCAMGRSFPGTWSPSVACRCRSASVVTLRPSTGTKSSAFS